MKHKIAFAAIAIFAVSIIFAGTAVPTEATGNGAPSGPHYNLNLIGKDKTDILKNDSNNGHRIFVSLHADGIAKKNKIYLAEGDFRVIDADATDGRAEFMLPDPYNADGERSYYVYVRELGKPGGSGSLTTCYSDVDGDYCLLGELTVPLNRGKGKSTFRNVTDELTTLCFDSDPDPEVVNVECESIFSDELKDYYWNYNNDGLKNVQLRFYPTS